MNAAAASPSRTASSVSLNAIAERDGALRLVIVGRLDTETTGQAWRKALELVARHTTKRLLVDASGLVYCDGAGVALLVELRARATDSFEIVGLQDTIRDLLALYEQGEVTHRRAEPVPAPLVAGLGHAAHDIYGDFYELMAYVGELTSVVGRALLRPLRVRWRDVLLVAERTGADALPIVLLIGFLIGLIMAFQSAIPMRQFGVVIYVADLVAISMLKELGPLMAAVIMAGRSGSAFAAEIGTMKVNDEINALMTMGIDPVRFLVLTRVLASVLMAPALAVFCGLAGVVGGAVVLLSMGYTFTAYWEHVVDAVTISAFLGGLVKSLVFGLLVAAIGCQRGLKTGLGATSVGISTTRAVVSGIVLICVWDAAFAVIFYALDI
ncbi:MAG: ABC transporter permease [Planctomycetota bacterium]